MSDLSDSNYIWFAIPEDGRGPSFGPVLKRTLAVRQARAMPGYVVGVLIDTGVDAMYEPPSEEEISNAATDEPCPAPVEKTWIEVEETRRGGWRP